MASDALLHSIIIIMISSLLLLQNRCLSWEVNEMRICAIFCRRHQGRFFVSCRRILVPFCCHRWSHWRSAEDPSRRRQRIAAGQMDLRPGRTQSPCQRCGHASGQRSTILRQGFDWPLALPTVTRHTPSSQTSAQADHCHPEEGEQPSQCPGFRKDFGSFACLRNQSQSLAPLNPQKVHDRNIWQWFATTQVKLYLIDTSKSGWKSLMPINFSFRAASLLVSSIKVWEVEIGQFYD